MTKALGLDLGTNTLGISHSDSLGFVHPIETFRFKHRDYEAALNRVIEILDEKGITEIALGLPLHLKGYESDMSKDCLAFQQLLLNNRDNIKVEMVDERLTTVQAHNIISEMNLSHDKRKAIIDQFSACEILETYLRKKEYNNGQH